MIGLIRLQNDARDKDYWNDDCENELADLLRLLVKVVPVAYIFRCEDYNAEIRLIIITNHQEYQESDKTRTLLDFIKIGHSNVHMIYFCYGTMLDYLRRGHLFFSVNCNLNNCIYKKEGLIMLTDNTSRLVKIKENVLQTFNFEIEKIGNFLCGAEFYLKMHKPKMATFMLHQTCEQVYRLVIQLFRCRDFKSHQLHC